MQLALTKFGKLSVAQMTNEKWGLALTYLIDRNPGSGEARNLAALAYQRVLAGSEDHREQRGPVSVSRRCRNDDGNAQTQTKQNWFHSRTASRNAPRGQIPIGFFSGRLDLSHRAAQSGTHALGRRQCTVSYSTVAGLRSAREVFSIPRRITVSVETVELPDGRLVDDFVQVYCKRQLITAICFWFGFSCGGLRCGQGGL